MTDVTTEFEQRVKETVLHIEDELPGAGDGERARKLDELAWEGADSLVGEKFGDVAPRHLLAAELGPDDSAPYVDVGSYLVGVTSVEEATRKLAFVKTYTYFLDECWGDW